MVKLTLARRTKFAVVTGLLTAGAMMAVAEGMVRLTWSRDHPKQPARWTFDADVGLVHQPGHYELPFRRCLPDRPCEDVHIRFSVNDQGFRSQRPFGATPGRPLVAVLGDSMIEAAQVHDGETAVDVLERSLAKEWQQVEVRNYGISSAGPVHYFARWRRFVRQTRPDVVVIGLTGSNDFRNSSPVLETFVAVTPHFSKSASDARAVWFEAPVTNYSALHRFGASLWSRLEVHRFYSWLRSAWSERASAE